MNPSAKIQRWFIGWRPLASKFRRILFLGKSLRRSRNGATKGSLWHVSWLQLVFLVWSFSRAILPSHYFTKAAVAACPRTVMLCPAVSSMTTWPGIWRSYLQNSQSVVFRTMVLRKPSKIWTSCVGVAKQPGKTSQWLTCIVQVSHARHGPSHFPYDNKF